MTQDTTPATKPGAHREDSAMADPGTFTVWFCIDLESPLSGISGIAAQTLHARRAETVARRLGCEFEDGPVEVSTVRDIGLTAPFARAAEVFAALAAAKALDGQTVDIEAERRLLPACSCAVGTWRGESADPREADRAPIAAAQPVEHPRAGLDWRRRLLE
jgi:hypothetical protein